MSVYNDSVWRERGNNDKCRILLRLRMKLADYCWDIWSLGPGSEKKWYVTCSRTPDGDWDKTSGLLMLNFEESGHPIFRATSALKRIEN